jgi:hypothetical protein
MCRALGWHCSGHTSPGPADRAKYCGTFLRGIRVWSTCCFHATWANLECFHVSIVDQSTFLSVDSRSHESGTINVLVYDTKAGENSATLRLVEQAGRLVGVKASLFGVDDEFEGFGSKYAALYPLLTKMAPNALVIVSDGYDVLVNNPANALDNTTPVSQFLAAYKEVIANHPNAIVVSAEAQCCVSALTHVLPGGYYNADGSRNARACASGEEDCLWVGDNEAEPWITFMLNNALDNKAKPDYEDLYLNAGLMVGSVRNPNAHYRILGHWQGRRRPSCSHRLHVPPPRRDPSRLWPKALWKQPRS